LPDPTPPLVELRGITKRFPSVTALDDVSFAMRAGEVHMLLGENGAGKSTLMKILCGAYPADSGEFFFQGAPVRIERPSDARRFGIAVIFQEFSLVPYLDIAQNIFLGREFKSRIPGLIDRGRTYAEAQRVLATIGFDIDPRTPVHRLSVAQQQMVEIAKALAQDARILVFDEPTSALSDRETERLFALIGRLKANGVAIVYIIASPRGGVRARRPHHRAARRPQDRRAAARRDLAGRARRAHGRALRRPDLLPYLLHHAGAAGARGGSSLLR
jgi:ribose transport system ATP-binding protein